MKECVREGARERKATEQVVVVGQRESSLEHIGAAGREFCD